MRKHVKDSLRFYVYSHVDPRTSKVMYVGKGSGGRAWACTTCRKPKGGKRGNRSVAHHEWFEDLMMQGYVPSDFVRIERQRLSNDEALAVERILVDLYHPPLNATRVAGAPKVTTEIAKEILKLIASGYTRDQVAEKTGLSKKTLWRVTANRIKALKR